MKLRSISTVLVLAAFVLLPMSERTLRAQVIPEPPAARKQISVSAKFLEASAETVEKMWKDLPGKRLAPAAPTLPAGKEIIDGTRAILLSPEETQQFLKKWEKQAGVDTLAAPKIITLSERPVLIKVVDIKYVVTDLEVTPTSVNPAKPGEAKIQPITEPFELGPVLDVYPKVQPDGSTLTLSVTLSVLATVKEFLGYDASGSLVTAPVPLPRFRVRQAGITASVPSKQTLLLTGIVRQEIKDQGKTKPVKPGEKAPPEKQMIVLITPEILKD